MAAAGFDLDAYQQLIRARERYRRYLAAAGSLHSSAAAAIADDGGDAAAAAAVGKPKLG